MSINVRKVTTGVKKSIFAFRSEILIGNRECKGFKVYDMNSRLLKTLDGHIYGADTFLHLRDDVLISTGYEKIIGWRDYNKDKEMTGLVDYVMRICKLDENTFITSDQDGNVFKWDYNAGKYVNKWNLDRYFSLSKIDDKRLLCGGFGRVDCFDMSSGNIVKKFKEGSSATSATLISTDDKLFASALDQKLIIWDMIDGKKLREFDLHKKFWSMISHGDYLVCGLAEGCVEVFHYEKGKVASVYDLCEGSIYQLSWRNKEKYEFLASKVDGDDDTVFVCSVDFEGDTKEK